MTRTAVLATALNAVSAIIPQIVSLTFLGAADYGKFSVVYLVYAAGASAVFSVIADAWSRKSATRRQNVGWAQYSSALGLLAMIFGLLGLLAGGLAGLGIPLALVAATAVAASAFRTGGRYFETRMDDWDHVLAGDLGSVAVALLFLACGLALDVAPMALAVLVWASGSVASVIAGTKPGRVRVRSSRRWLVVHRREIRALLSDSVLLDLGAIGTPYLLVPLLGMSNFGIYRAISNVATPIQLVLNPLRPVVAGASTRRLLSLRVLSSLTALLVGAGLACYAIIVTLPLLPIRMGVLSDLHLVALQASMFIPANGLSFYLYLVARSHAKVVMLFRARILQTVLAIAVPVAGGLHWGLSGAAWGFTGSALLFVVVWYLAAAEASAHELPGGATGSNALGNRQP